ncbi:hypothetical protein CHARACLAT_015729, partial [Characodon lateralis]|nr:hypothetical protein [Characodon lateralis]
MGQGLTNHHMVWEQSVLDNITAPLSFFLSPVRNAAYRGLTSAEVLQKDDPILHAERPAKESQKGCVLCSITVDFKNIQ